MTYKEMNEMDRGEFFRRCVNEPGFNEKALAINRKHLADTFRATRILVKENKARNGGVYVQEA